MKKKITDNSLILKIKKISNSKNERYFLTLASTLIF